MYLLGDFQVNIGSASRNSLKRLFDSKHYQKMKSRNLSVAKSLKPGQKRESKDSQDSSIRHASILSIHIEIGDDTNGAGTIFAIDDFLTFAESKDNLKEWELLKWLLKRLITKMETAVVEIAKLMKDSFIRFKMSDDIEFEKCVSLALQHVLSQQK